MNFSMQNRVLRVANLKNYSYSDFKSFRKLALTASGYDRITLKLFLYLLQLLHVNEIKPIKFSQFSPQNFSNPDNTSFLGAQYTGDLDLLPMQTVLRYSRSQIISYSTPFMFEERCFHLKVSSLQEQDLSYNFFFMPFSQSIWLFLATFFAICLIFKKCFDPSKQLKQTKMLRKIFFILIFAFFEVAYEANLRAVVTTRSEQTKPFENLNQLANQIANGNKRLVISSLNTDVFEVLNTTKGDGFDALRSALAINEPLLIPDENARVRMIIEDEQYLTFETNDIRLLGYKMFGKATVASMAEICLDEIPKTIRAVSVQKGAQLEILEAINQNVPFLYMEWLELTKEAQILQSLLSSEELNVDFQVLSLNLMVVPLIVLLAGIFCAFIIFFVERIF